MKISFCAIPITGLALFVLVNQSPGQAPPTPPATPRIEFDRTSFNVGTVWEGEKAVHSFTFKNTGSGTLRINKVRTSCGCTAALLSRKEIEPGDKGEIRAEFNTRRYRGDQRKQIYVSCNDPEQPTVRLALEAKVIAAAYLSPRSLHFRGIRRGEGASRVIRLVKEVPDLTINGIETIPEFFQARRLEGEPSKSGRETVEIEVALDPGTPPGRQQGKLTVRTDHPRFRKLEATLLAVVEGSVEYSPRALFFDQVDQEQRKVKKVSLSRKDEGNLEIISVTSTLTQFEVELIEVDPHRTYEISVRPKTGMAPGKYRGDVVVQTDQEGEEEIKIPLLARGNK